MFLVLLLIILGIPGLTIISIIFGALIIDIIYTIDAKTELKEVILSNMPNDKELRYFHDKMIDKTFTISDTFELIVKINNEYIQRMTIKGQKHTLRTFKTIPIQLIKNLLIRIMT